MANAERLFATSDNTVDYTSDTQYFASRGYRTGVFQVELQSGDEVVLQGRVSDSMSWLDLLDVHTSSTITEVVLAPQMRVVATNHSATSIIAMVTE